MKIPRYLYHGTLEVNLPNILEKGLGAEINYKIWEDVNSDNVFLTIDESMATDFVEVGLDENEELADLYYSEGSPLGRIVVLKIDTTYLDLALFILDRYYLDNNGVSFEYNGIILPEAVVDTICLYE